MQLRAIVPVSSFPPAAPPPAEASEVGSPPPEPPTAEPPVERATLTSEQTLKALESDYALRVDLGAETESNLYTGFIDDIRCGGVFVETYERCEPGSRLKLEITLPGANVAWVQGTVRFVRDDLFADAPPGVGVAFDALTDEALHLLRQFADHREPLFYPE